MHFRDYDEDMWNEVMEAIENLALMTQREFVAIHEELNGVRTDVSELRKDVDLMRSDINVLQKDVDLMRSDINAIHNDMDLMRSDIDAIRTDLHGIHEEMSDMHDEMRAGFAATNGVVVSHEYRLKRIEKP